MQMLLTPKDLSFVGYTYKNFDAVKGLRSLGMESISLYIDIFLFNSFIYLSASV